MGRSRIQKKSARVDEGYGEDTPSTALIGPSMEVRVPVEVEKKQRQAGTLNEFVEALYEKRANKREAGLAGVIGALTSNVMRKFVEEKFETLLYLLLGSVKRGSSTEKALAARVIGLLALTAGPGGIADRIMTEALPHLGKVAKADSSAFARVAALDTIAVLPFVGNTQLETAEDTMSSLWQICSFTGNLHLDQVGGTLRPSEVVKASAILSWVFMLSAVPTVNRARHHVELSLPTLLSLFKDDELCVRTAAWEALALVYEATKNHFPLCILEEVSGKLQTGDDMGINTSTHTIQLDALSRVLGEGFQRHLQKNVALHQICNFQLHVQRWQPISTKEKVLNGPRSMAQEIVLDHQTFKIQLLEQRATMSTKEKKWYMSPNSARSKARTQTRDRQRSMNQAGNQGHFNVNVHDD